MNFYRAQITELTRRMKSLMANSEHGFPSHQNMTQEFENEQSIRKPKSPTVTNDTPRSASNLTTITPAGCTGTKTPEINKSCIKKTLKIKHIVVPLTAVAPLSNSDIRCHNTLAVNNNNRGGGSLGSSSISSTRTNTTSSQQSSQNSSPEPTQLHQSHQQQQIHLLKQQQQKLVEVC